MRGAADSPPAHASLPFTGWSGGPVSDSDATLGFLSTRSNRDAYERAQAGRRIRPRSVLPRSGDVPRAVGPVGHREPAGGYRAGSAGKRLQGAVVLAGPPGGRSRNTGTVLNCPSILF